MRRRMLRHAVALIGLGGLVAALFLAVVLVFGRPPKGSEWTLLILSAAAAAACALLWVPARERLARLVPGDPRPPETALRAFGTRLTRSLPLDELLLQLCETLRRSLALDAAEIWTGAGGVLERAAADPDRPVAILTLTPAEQAVVGRAGVSGPAWSAVWLPQLSGGRDVTALRIAPVTNGGDLLGLIVVERAPDAEPFGDADEQLLADLARQLGLTLRNVHLD